MLITEVLTETKSLLMRAVGDDPLGAALAQRLHREAVVLDSSHVGSRDHIKTLEYISQLMPWTAAQEFEERFYAFKGTAGWAALYVPRSSKNNNPTINLMISTDQGIEIKPDVLTSKKTFQNIPATITKEIGSILSVLAINSGNHVDLSRIRRMKRTQQSPGDKRGVTFVYRQPIGQETTLLSRASSLMPAAGLEIKRYLRTAVRQGKLFVVPDVDFSDVSDMLDSFINQSDDSTDLLTRHSYTNIVGWWSRFLVDVAKEKYNFDKGAEDLGNNLTASQVVEVAKAAKEMLLALLLKKFFRKTKRK